MSKLDTQNITLAISKDVIKKAKHYVLEHDTSLSAYLAEKINEAAEHEDIYEVAKARNLNVLSHGFNLGTRQKSGKGRKGSHG